jgi:nucleotide-binding universal stress UspA family protein
MMAVIQEPVAISLEKILVATDFCVSSDRAVAYARALAMRFGSTLEVAHIFDPTVTTSWEAAELEIPPEDRERQSEERLAQVDLAIRQHGLETKPVLVGARRPAGALLDLAKRDGVDLIVAGTQSKVGLERLVLGSVAEQLIRGADCPVLTVGPKSRIPGEGPLTFQSVLFANDFSGEATKAAVFALAFAEDAGARLFCCYSIDDEQRFGETREALDTGFRKALKARIPESAYDWCSPECVVEHGAAARTILDLAERVNADLIVLGARKSTFWLTRVERGLTPALLAEATCPVLTVC